MMWRQFSVALSFLTVFRLPRGSSEDGAPEDLTRSFAAFPLVGLVLGGCSLLAAYLLGKIMPPLLAAVWTTVAATLLTRALHLDGLADLADGLGGGYTVARRLEIMKDSRSGAFGVIAVALALAVKIAAASAIISAGEWQAFPLILALSRCAIVAAAYKMDYARPEGGMGKPFLENMTGASVVWAAVLAVAMAAMLSPRFFWLYIGVGMLVVGAMRVLSRRMLGGVTGDVLGAVNEAAEMALFTIAGCLVSNH